MSEQRARTKCWHVARHVLVATTNASRPNVYCEIEFTIITVLSIWGVPKLSFHSSASMAAASAHGDPEIMKPFHVGQKPEKN